LTISGAQRELNQSDVSFSHKELEFKAEKSNIKECLKHLYFLIDRANKAYKTYGEDIVILDAERKAIEDQKNRQFQRLRMMPVAI